MPATLETHPRPLLLEGKLREFDMAIAAHPSLEIDSDYVLELESLATHYLKVVHLDRRVAYGVPLQALLDYETETLINALETGIFQPLFGVTRIVGYYSRISNWNKSKLGELADRHKGNYRVGAY